MKNVGSKPNHQPLEKCLSLQVTKSIFRSQVKSFLVGQIIQIHVNQIIVFLFLPQNHLPFSVLDSKLIVWRSSFFDSFLLHLLIFSCLSSLSISIFLCNLFKYNLESNLSISVVQYYQCSQFDSTNHLQCVLHCFLKNQQSFIISICNNFTIKNL